MKLNQAVKKFTKIRRKSWSNPEFFLEVPNNTWQECLAADTRNPHVFDLEELCADDWESADSCLCRALEGSIYDFCSEVDEVLPPETAKKLAQYLVKKGYTNV